MGDDVGGLLVWWVRDGAIVDGGVAVVLHTFGAPAPLRADQGDAFVVVAFAWERAGGATAVAELVELERY